MSASKYELNGLLYEIKNIQNSSNELLDPRAFKYRRASYLDFYQKATIIIQQYVVFSGRFNSIVEIDDKSKLKSILFDISKVRSKYDFVTDEALKYLLDIKNECSRGLGILKIFLGELTEEERKRIHAFREMLKNVEDKLPYNHKKNIGEAISELENKHYLSAALIAGRGFETARKCTFGAKSDNEIIEELINRGSIDKTRKDLSQTFLSVMRLSRNFTSHDVNVWPGSEESFSLVAGYFHFIKQCGGLKEDSVK